MTDTDLTQPAGGGERDLATDTYVRRLFLKAADERIAALAAIAMTDKRPHVAPQRDLARLHTANAFYETARTELLAEIERADCAAAAEDKP